MEYKSSPFTMFFKYGTPIIYLGVMGFSILMLLNNSLDELKGLMNASFVISVWLIFVFAQNIVKLKRVSATENGIEVKDIGKKYTVEYKDIQWVARFDISCIMFITIKFYDNVSGNYRKIAFMPNSKDQRFFQIDAMSQHIRDKIKSENPSFSEEMQPSAVKNFAITTLLSLPFILLAWYFMGVNFL